MLSEVRAAIRDVPDFPKQGIVFKDITPVLENPVLFKQLIDVFAERHASNKIKKVAAVDARGFIFGAALAYALGAGFVPIRKQGKLPFKTHDESYDLEYGHATLSLHVDAFKPGERVLVMDDLLATGGTALAAARLVSKAGGQIFEIDFFIELAFLKGREKLASYPVFAPIVF